MNAPTQEMIDAGATALCGLTREQVKSPEAAEAYQVATDQVKWIWTLMTAAAPKSSDEPTLRDMFAAKALHADTCEGGLPRKEIDKEILAEHAYSMADIMMRERAK